MELLEKHFEIVIGNPNGILKLRELIYDLGLKSKLVSSDQNEKSKFDELNKGSSFIKENETPYNIPTNWSWKYLGEIINVKSSKRIFEKDYVHEGIPFYRSKEVGELSRNGECEERLFISREKYNEIKNKYGTAKKGDILLTSVGSIGGSWIVDNREFYYKDGNVTLLEVNNIILSKYLSIFIKSTLFREQVSISVSGTAYNALTIIKIKSLKIPIPPIKEQERIVEKIEQLMRLCDILEEQRDSKNDLLSKINSSAINKLITAEDESSLNAAWEFIQNKFEIIFADKKNIFDLKEVILNLAMRGKLATSDSKDGSASKLLVEIEEERKLLIKQKLLSKQKELPLIAEKDKKHSLPHGWKWVRLNEYGTWKSGSTPSRTNQSYYGGDIPWVKSGEVKQGRIKETSETITEIAIQKCSLHRNPIGSVLIAMYGANIGEVGVLEIEAATNQAVCACKTYTPINNEFLYYLLLSLRSNFISQGAGAAQPNISREKIINTIVPLPPFNEQKRIVQKIENLFQLADSLESNIVESSKKQVQILNSVLANI